LGSHLDLEPVRHCLAVRDGIHHLNRLVSGVGGADVPSHRHAAWKLKRSLFIATGEPGALEVLDESGHLHTESSQFGVDAIRDEDGSFKLAACREPWVVIDLHKLHRLVIDHEPQPSHDLGTRDQARDFMHDLLAGVARDTWVDPRRGKQPFGEWARQWWATWSSDPDRSPTTLEATEARFRLHVLPYFEHRQLRAITVTVVRRWQNELKGARGRGTVMAARSILYRILQAAEDERLIVANPVRKVPAPKLEVDPDELLGQGKRRALTPEEAGQLLARFPPVWWDHVVTLLGTGLRFGELGGLRRHRVLLNRTPPVLQVVATRYQAGRFGSGFKGQPKSQAGIRSIPLAHQVAEAVRRQLPHGATGDDLVFTDPPAANTAAGRAPLSRYLFRHVYHRAVNRLTDPTREPSPTTRRVLRAFREHGPQTLAQLQESFTTLGAKLRPATIQAALRELGSAGIVVTAVGEDGTARWAAVKAAQVRRFDDLDLHGPHDLRHTFATWLEDAGIPGRVIDELMGHDNTHRARQDRVSRIGMGYRDTTPEMLMRAVAAIESRLAVVLEVAARETKPLLGLGEP
jgi:integrase